MTELEDRELGRVRLRFLDICKSFFDTEPDAERFAHWRGLFAALIKEPVAPALDGPVRELFNLLNKITLARLQDEYYRLFVDPFSELQVPMTASEYREGRTYGRTLAEFRGFLQEAGIQKTEAVSEAEDSLVVMLDVMARLVEREGEDFERARLQQAELLDTYLHPLIDGFSAAVGEKTDTMFYPVCSRFMKGYLQLERGLSADVLSSDEERQLRC
jgi:TorA maturation chaperone TorD